MEDCKLLKPGDVIALVSPKVENKKFFVSSAKSTEGDPSAKGVVLLGTAKDYSQCSYKGCAEFLNKSKHTVCRYHELHKAEETMRAIKARRPYLRGNEMNIQRVK